MVWNQIISRIVAEQELIIGPLAWEEAAKVAGLTVDAAQKTVAITDEKNAAEVINKLVAQYERLFGRASVEVCRDAVKDLLPSLQKEEVPQALA